MPVPWERPTNVDIMRRQADARGETLNDPPPSVTVDRPRVVYAEAPWWRTAKGMAIVVPLLVTLLTALTGSAVLIIKSLRESYEGARAKDIAEAKAAAQAARDAVDLETKARQAKDEELWKKETEQDGALSDFARRVPAVKSKK